MPALTLKYLNTLKPEDQQLAILKEYSKCRNDIEYCMRTYFTVMDPKKGVRVAFSMYPYQGQAVNDFQTFRYNMTMKTRQTGLTTVCTVYAAAYMCLKKNQIVYALANKLKVSRKFLKMVRDALDEARKHYPWLVPAYLDGNDGKDSFSVATGCIITAEPNTDEACRSETINLLFIDEVAAIDKLHPGRMEAIWASAGPTLGRSGGSCIAISCVTKDTFIFTDKGIQQIDDFIPKNINTTIKSDHKIEPYNIRGKDKKRSSDLFHCDGFGKTRKIITSYAELEGSLKHKAWAYKADENKYRICRFDQLTTNDWVNIQYGMNCWGNNNDVSDFESQHVSATKQICFPKTLTPDWCYLFGLYISEGCTSNYKNDKYNSIYITCGDDITKVFDRLNLKYYTNDNLRYQLSSIQLCEFFEYLGLNPSQKAHQKEIPKRLMSISKDNMRALLQGIFDGDGYATTRGSIERIGINLSSKKLIEQIRVILVNFGILSLQSKLTKEKMNSYKPKNEFKHDGYRLETNGHFALQFHKEIGFRLERKQRSVATNKMFKSIVPNGNYLLKEICKKTGLTENFLRSKQKIYIDYNKSVSYYNLYKLVKYTLDKNLLSQNDELIQLIQDRVLIENSIWVPIKEIRELENETFDVSLPENKDDFWCHSVVFNGILGENTPKGQNGWYYEQYIHAQENGWNIVEAHWSAHPDYRLGLYVFAKTEDDKNVIDAIETHGLAIIDKREVPGGEIVFFDSGWPDTTHSADLRAFKTRETYNFILDGRLRSPWYDTESKRLGPQMTRCELDCSFAGSGSEVLDAEILRALNVMTQKFRPISAPGKGVWKSYKEYEIPNVHNSYVISVDTATGDGSDFSSFAVTNCQTKKVVATFKDQLFPDVFSDVVATVGARFNNAVAVVENAGGGLTVLLGLQKLKYPHIYRHKLKSKDPGTRDRRSKLGLWMDEAVRDLCTSKLDEWIRTDTLKVYSEELVAELHTWIWDKDGKRRHAPGKHDDVIMATAMGVYYIAYVLESQGQNKENMNTMFSVDRIGLGDGKNGPNKGFRISYM